MFTKQLKYDFMFSYKTFFTMFAGIIALSLVVRVADILPDMPDMLSDILRMIVIGAGGTAVAVASYVQILMFYQRSFFGAEGYLTLTLPLSRGRQLASKLITTFVWFIFMAIAVPIMIFILAPPTDNLWQAILNTIDGNFVTMLIVNIFLPAIAMISMLFLGITLANSVIFNKKIHGVIAGLATIVLHILFFWGFSSLSNRFMETETINFGGDLWSQTIYTPLVGLQYGRIPFEGWGGGFVDIFAIVYSLAAAAVMVILTLYLLKKRIALR
ncbi:MAG: hypothetical protein FWB98_09050 [Defluviitaleaceae bacterium]|nr:hypothetical protein [Defluviitaleaceae bacterium]